MITKIKENIFQISLNFMESCVYLLKKEDKLILIDTAGEGARDELLNSLKELKIDPEDINIIILTHDHFDHTENIKLFNNAEMYGSLIDFKDKNIIDINKLKIKDMEIIKTPGHTMGSICVYLPKEKILFSGDTIFNHGGIGRTDFFNSSIEEMQKSLEKLKKIDYEILCPGHSYS